MTVIFVIDRFNIDTEEAIVAETSIHAIEQLRQTINQHLRHEDSNLLRVRFNNLALFERFRDFDGVEGVLPIQQLIPRTVYRKRVDENLPLWLSDELIIQLGLLTHQHATSLDIPLIDTIIKSCDADLLSEKFPAFTRASIKHSETFSHLLKIADIQARFVNNFQLAFDFSEDLALLLIEQLLVSSSLNDFFITLAYEQHQQLLQAQLTQFKLPLLGESLPALLLTVPLLTLEEQDAKELPIHCLTALDLISLEIKKGNINASDIADLIVAPWTTVLDKLLLLILENNALISTELVAKLESFQDKKASQLAVEITEQLERSKFSVLPESATTDEVLAWSTDYFELMRQKFSSDEAIEEHLNLSFTEWLLKKSARIARSDADWRQFSKRVESFLKQNYLVIVCMVDALSALNTDLLLESSSKIEHLTRSSETLFAPIPTLTEIGKMALITGTETCDLPSDKETAIRQRYKKYLPEEKSLKFITSWKATDKKFNEKTNLLVFFENRIDEQLHKCIEFKNHRKDVSNILSQMMSSVEKWKKDAGSMNRDVVFLITADHGMTVTQASYEGGNLGDVKERVFEVAKSYQNKNEAFSYVPNADKNAFLIPKKRLRLTRKALLSHGGLTPEEVLIPFVTLTSKIPDSIKTPLELKVLNEKCQRVAEKSWELSVELVASVRVDNICIKFEAPFIGEASLTTIAENSTQKLLLSFSAPVEQSGLRALSLQLTYDRTGAHEVNNKLINCLFTKPLLEKDSATQSYEDMFS